MGCHIVAAHIYKQYIDVSHLGLVGGSGGGVGRDEGWDLVCCLGRARQVSYQVAWCFAGDTPRWAVAFAWCRMVINLLAFEGVVCRPVVPTTPVAAEGILWKRAAESLMTQPMAVRALEDWRPCLPSLECDGLAKHRQVRACHGPCD
jgi:hypothetical protein